jgi:glycosyltransferase involved in cell wall biosynthesis
MVSQDKLVSVLTPVYNGALYLEECIQSVLRQTYNNFEFIIVDNCSSDDSFDIASEAADGDKRISVIRSHDHVGPIQNWNRSLGYVSDQAEYVKFVHADDWLFATCIERMVALAEENDRVALVSAYRLEEDRVSLDRLPHQIPSEPGSDWFTMNGRAIARSILMEGTSVLGSPTAVLLRTRLMGNLDRYFSTEYLHADKEAALRMFQDSDFGFIRQVLTYTRRHNESVTSLTNTIDTRRQENLLFLRKYGHIYLSDDEYERAWSRELAGYYRFLARNFATGKGRQFWESHEQNLDKAGSPLDRSRLYRAVARRWLNPASAFREMRQQSSQAAGSANGQVHGFLDLSRNEAAAKEPQQDKSRV